MALFLLEVAAENDKTQGEQTKHKSVFLWFGDDLAVDNDPHRAVESPRKMGRSYVTRLCPPVEYAGCFGNGFAGSPAGL